MLRSSASAVPDDASLAGMLLTLADMGKKETTVVSPPGLVATFLATRSFLRRGDVTLDLTEVLPAAPGAAAAAVASSAAANPTAPTPMSDVSIVDVEGGVQLVTACVLPAGCSLFYPPAQGLPSAATPPARSIIQLPTCPRLACAVGTPLGPVPLPTPEAGSGAAPGVRFSDFTPFIRVTGSDSSAFTPPSSCSAPVAVHIVTTPVQRGKFHPKRAVALGVPKGKMFGALASGNAVTLDDGTVINPEQVKDADRPGVAVAAVPCPTHSHIAAVTEHPIWNEFVPDGTCTLPIAQPSPQLQLVFHLGPAAVVSTPQYRQWCCAFPAAVQHVFLNEHVSSKCPVFRASAGHAARLHLISPSVFPLPWPLNLAEHKSALGLPDLLRRAAGSPLPVHSPTPSEAIVDAAQGPHGVVVGGQRKRGRGGQAKSKPAEVEPYVPVRTPASVPVDDQPLAWPLQLDTATATATATPERLGLSGHPLLKLHLLPEARSGVVDVAHLRDLDAFRSDLQSHIMSLLQQPSIRPLLPALAVIAATHSAGDSQATAKRGTSGSPEHNGLAVAAGVSTPLGETLGVALSQDSAGPTAAMVVGGEGGGSPGGGGEVGLAAGDSPGVIDALPSLDLGAAGTAPSVPSAISSAVFDSDSDNDVMLMSAACGPTPDGLTTWTFGSVSKTAARTAEAAVAAAGVPPALQAAADAGLAPPRTAPAMHSKAVVVFLGTGSALPSKYRNVTGVWMATPSGRGVLFDAGEGTFGQMVRRFGTEHQPGWAHGLPKSAHEAVAELALLWVSHMHADHHLGVPRILQERPEGGAPLLVVAPHEMLLWLQELSLIMPGIAGKWVFLPCSHFDAFPDAPHGLVAPLDPLAAAAQQERQHKAAADAIAAGKPLFVPAPPENTAVATPAGTAALQCALSALGVTSVHTARVVHCNDAWALRLQSTPQASSGVSATPALRSATAGEWSVCVSGDCRPCDSVAALAAGASLLIHEATFADGMEQEASDKRHATTQEALTVARSAGVHATLLYHFSQRYPKLPASAADVSHPVCVAFDFMTVRGHDLVKLPALWPALCAVYDNSMAEDEGNA